MGSFLIRAVSAVAVAVLISGKPARAIHEIVDVRLNRLVTGQFDAPTNIRTCHILSGSQIGRSIGRPHCLYWGAALQNVAKRGCARFGISHISSAARNDVKFVALKYPIIDEKLRLSVPGVEIPRRSNNVGTCRSDNEAARDWFEPIARFVFWNGNIVDIGIEWIVAIDNVVSDFEYNVSGRFTSRIDESDVETDSLILRQRPRDLGANRSDPRPLGSFERTLSFNDAPYADSDEKNGGQSRPKIGAANILGKATTGFYFLLGIALLASCGVGHALSPAPLRWPISLVMFGASILVLMAAFSRVVPLI
jgi:hypothetical protein